MAKAARCSAGFPGLFQPVSWNADDGKKFIIDGGIRDGLGLNGLSAFPSKSSRVINLAVGDYGMSGSNGLKDLPDVVEADSLVSIAIVNTPMCSPWAMSNGPKAVESARKAMVAMLDTPMERGTSKSHFVLRVDASKFISA
jgi:predicted acylesterase/phospholipase RssA